MLGCKKDDPSVKPEPEPEPEPQPTGILTPEDVPDYDKIYMCSEFYKNKRGWDVTSTFYDPLLPDSFYYFGRSKQSEHFIIFWDKDFGDKTPDQSASPYHLDTDSFLQWCEQIYKYYIETLKFAHFTPEEKSYLDQYKFQIYLWHQTEWAAYGSGPDDNITGCLWVNPEAANSRSTVAHEVGHSFQYQVGCDLILNKKATDINKVAFRYNQGQASSIWEQTAQWQSFQMCPEETFTNYYFSIFCDNAHRHFCHEDMRYGSYFFHYYWVDKYGQDAVARVWHDAVYPKDALESYMATYGIGIEEFNEQVYDYATRVVTWDFDNIRTDGAKYAGAITWKGNDAREGYYQVDDSRSPEATGFNIIRLSAAPGDELKAELVGMDASADAGWKIGFVTLGSDKATRTYGPHASASAGSDASVSWTVPSGAQYVWAVVACTPSKYYRHNWDENNSNDRHWPYKVRFSLNGVPVDMATPSSGSLEGAGLGSTYSWTMTGTTIAVNVDIDTDEAAARGGFEVGHFELPVDKVNEFIGADVRELDESSFTCYNPDGTLVDMTSYKPGMWVDIDGKSCSWSSGTAFWQWYVWGGKKDKNGSTITYDGDPQGKGENQGRFFVGMHPDHVAAAKGKTIVFRNKIAASQTYDFIITYKFL